MSILLLWTISDSFLLVMYHDSLCLRLCFALTMMPCLMISVTIFLTLITISISMMTKSSLMTLLFNIHLLLMRFGWVNLSARLVVMSLKNVVALLEIVYKSIGLIRLLMTLLTHFQSWLSSLIVIVKFQTGHLQPLFQREKMPLLNRIKKMSQLYHLMIPMREHSSTFHLLNLMTLQSLLMMLLLLIPPTPPMNLILSIYAKASKFGNANLAVSIKPTRLPVPFDPSRFQFMLPNSPVSKSRVNNPIVFGMRLVILCWMPCL